jgi:hypothetical protein
MDKYSDIQKKIDCLYEPFDKEYEEKVIEAFSEIGCMSFVMEYDALQDFVKRLETGEAYENIWVHGG